MSNKLIYYWIVISISLISISIVNIDDQLFFPSVIFIVTSLIVVVYLKTREIKYILRIILISCIFSVLSTISLFDNYVSSIIEEQDGISISNKLAYLYIGEDGWSKELFRNAFEQAFFITEVLVVLYMLLFIIEFVKTKKGKGT